MIVWKESDLDEIDDIDPMCCSYCSQPLNVAFIYWATSHGPLCLHPDCVQDFFTALDLEAKEIRGEI